MDGPMVNSQRGVSYLPGAAAKQREGENARAAKEQEQRIEDQIQALSPKKAHAIKLDQIEHAYKERARDRGRPTNR